MPRYDIERFCTDLETFLQADLPEKLSAIAAEKSDGIALPAPDNEAYFFQTMNNSEAAYSPYLFFGIVNISSNSRHGAVAKTYDIHVLIVSDDNGSDPNIAQRMLRYQRGLEELMTEDYSSVGGGQKITVGSMVPISLTDLNTARTERVIGISIQVTIP